MLIVTTTVATIKAFLLPLARRCRDKGWSVDAASAGILAGAELGNAFERCWGMPWSRTIGKVRGNVAGFFEIRKIIRSNGYDIVHVHTPIASFITRIANLTIPRNLRPIVVYTAHGFHFHRNGKWLDNLLFLCVENIANLGTDAIITINKEDETNARKWRLTPSNHIYRMPGIGIDLSFYRRERFSVAEVLEWRRQEGIPIDAPLFVMVAEFEPGKRHVDAIDALAICRLENAHLAFAGDGRMMPVVRKKAEDLGLSGRCHFLGLRKDVPLIIASADAMLMPSEREGLPRSVMEAMAMGTPVIGADSRGIRDLLGNDCGLLHRVYEPKEIARMMELIIRDKVLSARITENALLRVQECDLEKVLRIQGEIYEELLSVTPGRRNRGEFAPNTAHQPRMLGQQLHILVAGGNADSLVNFRGHLLRELLRLEHKVVAVAPSGSGRTSQQLRSWGVEFVPMGLERAGFNPWSDWRYLQNLAALVRERKIDLVIAYTHKPVIFGAMAVAMGPPSIPFYAIITGLGYAFMDGGSPQQLIVKRALCWFYRKMGRRFHGIIFQNNDDKKLFEELELIPAELQRCVVDGSGVDLDFFRETPVPAGPPCFLLIARLLKDKGIREYVAAARLVRTVHPETEFHLVGPEDPNPSAIPLTDIRAWEREGAIIYHGACDDVRQHLNRCTVYVLPSYREGTPRTVLEAMAVGRAIITTDTPGCRETILDPMAPDRNGVRIGSNGFLVPVKSVEGLSRSMNRLAEDRPLQLEMGRKSRAYVEARYDVKAVTAQILSFIGVNSNEP